MIRWLVAIFILLVLFSRMHHHLHKLGLGRLPGDFRFRLFGREIFLPFASSVRLSLAALLIGKLF